MNKRHSYCTCVRWTGNEGVGTQNYSAYSRNHDLIVANKKAIQCSSDKAFSGDATRHNPEEMLVYALSSCHMLWYLHLCSVEGVIVLEYTDCAEGIMKENLDGSGQFEQVVLKPNIKIKANNTVQKALLLHEKAHTYCFIANSVNFKVSCEPTITEE